MPTASNARPYTLHENGTLLMCENMAIATPKRFRPEVNVAMWSAREDETVASNFFTGVLFEALVRQDLARIRGRRFDLCDIYVCRLAHDVPPTIPLEPFLALGFVSDLLPSGPKLLVVGREAGDALANCARDVSLNVTMISSEADPRDYLRDNTLIMTDIPQAEWTHGDLGVPVVHILSSPSSA